MPRVARKPTISGDELRAMRKQCGISQKKLAEILGVSPPCVTQWEVGRRPAPKWAVIFYRLLAAKRQALITGQRPTLEL